MPNTAATPPRGFTVPADLLRQFTNEVRFIPTHLPTNGYIVFDRAMLLTVLRGDNKEARFALATSIEALGKADGELVVMQNPIAR
jgi:hypothetical protein